MHNIIEMSVKLVQLRKLLSFYLFVGLYESAEFAQIGSNRSGNVHKWTLFLK